MRAVPIQANEATTRTGSIIPVFAKNTSDITLQDYRRTVRRPAETPALGRLTLGMEGFTYPLMHFVSQHHRLVRPILLTVQHGESGKLVVSDSHAHMYGVGESLGEALSDYESMLLDYFEDLAQNRDAISDYLSKQLAWMLEVIERV